VSAAGDDGNAIKIGDQWDDVRSRTSLKNVTDDTTVLWLETTDGTAVHGQATTGWGVEGVATGTDFSGIGVYGHAANGGKGVLGESAWGTGVTGNSPSGFGVFGQSTSGTGVFGQSTNATGVIGGSNSGTGVRGISTSGFGVIGISTSGTGVYGISTSGTGVAASSTSGRALDVAGKAHFNRSGTATVTAGHKSVTVTVPGGLTGTPLCFANLRSYRSGIGVAAVRSNYPSAGKIRIYLTRVVSSATSVAWMVMD